MKVNTFKPKETRFFRDVVLQSIRQRQESGERKNDLIDLMIDSMKEEEKEGGEEEKLKIDEELVVATAMVMLIAGCESENFAKMFDILLTKCFGGIRNL
jgi:cytochrome P450